MLLFGDVFSLVRDVQKFGFMFVAIYTHENGDQWTSIDALRDLPFGMNCIFSWRHAVSQLVEALRYKPEGRELNSRSCHWNFSLT